MSTSYQGRDQHDDVPLTSSQKTFIWTIAAILVIASSITLSLAVLTGGDGGNDTGVVATRVTTPTITPSPTERPAVAAATETPSPTDALPALTATPPATASSISSTPTVGLPVSTSPVSTAPTSSHAGLFPLAQALAAAIEAEHGVRIVDGGQDWGLTEEAQLRNIGAVRDALAGVPLVVRVTANSRMPLAILSNHSGMTEAGWQPYGNREANYYTNEDVSTSGSIPSNQIVLQPGANSQTIAHEMMHAYQMRDVAPGQYGMALLSPHMKSFMAATGWTQIGSDDDVRAATDAGWTAINALFEYNGRALIYNNQFGDSMSLFAPNPLEAYAEAGGLYYGHNEALVLPEWAEYWDWFEANLG